MKDINLHNIVSKEQLHQKAPGETGGTFTDIPLTTYKLDYSYDVNDKPHAPRTIVDKPYANSTGNDIKTKMYDYDANGNLTHITQKTGESETIEKLRTNLWDEENRLRAVDITPDAEGVRPIAIYTYDAGGERVLKHSNTSVSIFLNGKKVADTIQVNATLYPSGMTVFRPSFGGEGGGAYTKHYFAGTQRVSSKIGTTENLGDFLYDWYTQGTGGPVDVIGSSFGVLENAEEGVIKVYDEFGIDPPTYDSSPVFIPIQSFVHGGNEVEQYFFHPDHLGSTSYITNLLGEVSQHMEYFAFGETFVEEHRSSNNSPYKFNGKELDEETGWYYYGARYYDPRVSVWLSVDPLAEQTMTPYQYSYQNPVMFIDPDGKLPIHIDPSAIYYSTNNSNIIEAWEFFANSKIGISFLKDFAQAGQTIGNHTYTQDGKYHKKGINLILGTGACTTEYNRKHLLPASGLTESIIRPDGSFDIKIDVENIQGKTDNNLSTFLHEFFLHALNSADDFFDNKKLDFSNGYPEWFMDFINKNWSDKNKTNKRLIDHKLEKNKFNKNKRLEKYGVPIMEDFYKSKGIEKDPKSIRDEMYKFVE